MDISPKQSETIMAVILAGTCSIENGSLSGRLPSCLWPIIDRSALQNLVKHIAAAGITKCLICYDKRMKVIRESIAVPDSLDAVFLPEELAQGAAGCIREAAKVESAETLLVINASMASPPDIREIIAKHQDNNCDMSMFFNPSQDNASQIGTPAEIYLCDCSILEFIPDQGYCDLKESLIPKMVKANAMICASILNDDVGNFRKWDDYLTVIERIMTTFQNRGPSLNGYSRLQADVLTGRNVTIASGVKLFGPVIISDNAHISENAVIFGPAVIGPRCHIGQNSLLAETILWKNARVGDNCRIEHCVIENDAVIGDDLIIEYEAVPQKTANLLQTISARIKPVLAPAAFPVTAAIITLTFLWSYWPGITNLWRIWLRSDEYSSGMLVPLLAIYILWAKRDTLKQCRVNPSMWGLVGFFMAQVLRYFGIIFMYGSAQRLSLVLSVASIVLLLFGWGVFRKVSPVFIFMLLMLPLPRSVHNAVMLPLQNLGTSLAVSLLEILGFAVLREGNVIQIEQTSIAIVEACNGLRMATAFFIIIGVIVLLSQRSAIQKLILIISGIPVALLCNTLRLTITAIAFTVMDAVKWEAFFHDFGGYAMMPIALIVIYLEMGLLEKLTSPSPQKQTIYAAAKIHSSLS